MWICPSPLHYAGAKVYWAKQVVRSPTPEGISLCMVDPLFTQKNTTGIDMVSACWDIAGTTWTYRYTPELRCTLPFSRHVPVRNRKARLAQGEPASPFNAGWHYCLRTHSARFAAIQHLGSCTTTTKAGSRVRPYQPRLRIGPDAPATFPAQARR